MHNNPLKILICYDYFFPGYKAGGPVQSLVNLVTALANQYQFYIITSAFDLHAKTPYNVACNQWNNVMLPGAQQPVNVWYGSAGHPSYSELNYIFKSVSPDTIYLNGLYSYHFFLLPVVALKSFKKIRLVISPRGMLQQGALHGKSFKKSIYLNFLKATGLLTNATWHATSGEEEKDIKLHFKTDRVYQASNIPKKPWLTISSSTKQVGQIHLVYLSLIAEKKNLHVLLEALQQTAGITLDVYGPVKDKAYWHTCLQLMEAMPKIAKYKGEVEPATVQDILSKYDALALLTKGENFGHAIYESLSVGRPVIVSHFTPWKNLYNSFAGWNSSLEIETIRGLFENIKIMSHEQYEVCCAGAHDLAKSYYDNLNIDKPYALLFKNANRHHSLV